MLERVVRVVFLIALALVAIAAPATAWHQIGRIGPFGWLAVIRVTLGATMLGDFVWAWHAPLGHAPLAMGSRGTFDAPPSPR